MAIPTSFGDLSTTAASNPPDGATEQANTIDGHLQAAYALIKQLYEGSTNGQVVFPATQNASSNANTLDDYEEGTFTPSDASGASLTFAAAAGRYIKIGKLVHVQLGVTYPATASTASAVIGGLPFTAVTSSTARASLAIGFRTGTNLTSALVFSNATSISLYNGNIFATNANLSAYEIFLSGTYEADA